MIEYFNRLEDEEKDALTAVIQLLYRQTYLLEKKYERKSARYQFSNDYRVCERHLDFLKEYFKIGGLELIENRQYGIISLKSNILQGEKLSKLSTIFVLILKLIFDEQMSTVSNSIHIFTSLEDIYEKVRLFHLWENKAIPITEVRKALATLKKYQVIEVLDAKDELDKDTRILIYPTIQVLMNGMDLLRIIETYSEKEEEEKTDGQLSGVDKNVLE